MNTELYLDTARLGQMCRGARMAERDFASLVSQLRSSLYFGRFLTDGFDALSSHDRQRFRSLQCWSGVTGFKREFGRFVSQPPCPTFLFSASQSLIRFAAECLFDSAGNVLTTDLVWPPYLETLQRVAARRDASLYVLGLRSMVFHGRADVNAVVQAIVHHYRDHDCDGLFLSDISYLGVRMPVREVMQGLTSHRRPFLVVDGAQAFGQRPVDIQDMNCDLYLAGTQKWFAACHPLRLAFTGRAESLTSIHNVRGSLFGSSNFYDPLLAFTGAIERNEFRSFGETVNLTPLIAAAGALRGLARNPQKLERRWQTYRRNAHTVIATLASSFLWGGRVHPDLRSGIVLVPGPIRATSRATLISVRAALTRFQIAATVFPDGDLRLAMPSFTLSLQHLIRIKAAVQGNPNLPQPNRHYSNPIGSPDLAGSRTFWRTN